MINVNGRAKRVNVPQLRKQLGYKHQIPQNTAFVQSQVVLPGRLGEIIGQTDVRVIKGAVVFRPGGQRGKSSSHRIYLRCEKCGEWIPAGRYHQHYGSMKCQLTEKFILATKYEFIN